MSVNKESKKKKVALCYVQYHHYRIPVFEMLGEIYDLTVIYGSAPTIGSVSKSNSSNPYTEILIPARKFWRFRFQSGLLGLVRKGDFDAVIFMLDIAWLSTMLSFLFCPTKTRRITWGLWYTKNPVANRVRNILAKLADGNVFYATGAAHDFLAAGVPAAKIWIARNTVKVDPVERQVGARRNTILFLGSFNERKRNDVTIAAFDKACEYIPEDISLILVGDGPAKEKAKQQVSALPNRGRIHFEQGTKDDDRIRKYYAQALASVSYGQAGLSVLQSFGHGVSFITKRDAISGGEIENIMQSETGILCDSTQESLMGAFVKVCNDLHYADRLGNGALQYYQARSTVHHMVAGFAGAVENAHQDCENIL